MGHTDPAHGRREAIRSYRHRNGRMGPQLQRAWTVTAPRLMMPDAPWTDGELAPPGTEAVVLEIGSGMGRSVAALAGAHPSWLVIANDVSIRCMAATARDAEVGGLENVRLWRGDALLLLHDLVPEGGLHEIHVWFPDPWPKQAHHKRRLVRPLFAALAAKALRSRGTIRMATDWADYAESARTVLLAEEGLTPLGNGGVVPRPGMRPMTNYERRGVSAGRDITDLAFQRV